MGFQYGKLFKTVQTALSLLISSHCFINPFTISLLEIQHGTSCNIVFSPRTFDDNSSFS